jgi:hypothetical protein
MKKNKLLLLISILFISIISITYAAWWWVKWIWESETVDRFWTATIVDWVSAYTDSFTWFKWQATDTSWAWMTWPAWSTHCTNLWWAWRLPTRKEIYSIMTDKEVNWAGKYTRLESIIADHYWTSTIKYVTPPDYKYFGIFREGGMAYNHHTAALYQVLCIHD